MGQEVTVRALSNALAGNRLHHAYLFTGTRGVGKTTIARILAKCFSCEIGISAVPCGSCGACLEVDKGCFTDLIEIDAASRTKVEDMREILENVQYLPTRGRFKIYLIDEVHMLSGHSFNALLKTLEEPPPHVKFLLATTDPQKLPMTVLSRCLQFHLWRVPIPIIADYLSDILQREGVSIENTALQALARAADGSLRDALSLLEQVMALSLSKPCIEAETVRQMLGLSKKAVLLELLTAVLAGSHRLVLEKVQALANSVPDFSGVLAELLDLLYQIAVAQNAVEALDKNREEYDAIVRLAQSCQPEEVQKCYQIGIRGQRDLAYAPSPQVGFEMVLLRMVQESRSDASSVSSEVSRSEGPSEIRHADELADPIEALSRTATAVPGVESATPSLPIMSPPEEIPKWETIIPRLHLKGAAQMLAEHATVGQWSSNSIQLVVDGSCKGLWQGAHNQSAKARLQTALSEYLGRNIHLTIIEGSIDGETPIMQKRRLEQEKLKKTTENIAADSTMQDFLSAFGAEIKQVEVKEADEF